MSLESIRATLEVEYPILTEQVNGESVELTPEQRSAVLDSWAAAQHAALNLKAEYDARKVWGTVQDFIAEFTMQELALISLSANPVVAALRFKLATWKDRVFSDNPEVVLGLDVLVSVGILTQLRKDAILAKAQ